MFFVGIHSAIKFHKTACLSSDARFIRHKPLLQRKSSNKCLKSKNLLDNDHAVLAYTFQNKLGKTSYQHVKATSSCFLQARLYFKLKNYILTKLGSINSSLGFEFYPDRLFRFCKFCKSSMKLFTFTKASL